MEKREYAIFIAILDQMKSSSSSRAQGDVDIYFSWLVICVCGMAFSVYWVSG